MKAIYVPDNFVKQANSFLFKFLWRNKKTHIKNSAIIGDVDEGGLKMTDVIEMNKALTLIMQSNSIWTCLPNFYFQKLMNNKIKDNALCKHCNLEETLEHLFYDCNDTKLFWSDFQDFFQQNLKTQQNIELTCKEFIFGVLPQKEMNY